MGRLLRAEKILALLLVFVPVTVISHYVLDAGAVLVFVSAALAIVPLAGLMGRSTEALAVHVGTGLGGLLNATFGNAAELIIAFFALREGLFDLVKASLTGSIIGNVLLVFGLAALLGGLKRPRQSFNPTAASMGATMLLLSAVALVVPAIFHQVAGPEVAGQEQLLSLALAIVLMATYLLGLLFTLRTHSHLYVGTGGSFRPAGPEAGVAAPPGAGVAAPSEVSAEGPVRVGSEAESGGGEAHWSAGVAVAVLLGAAAVVGLMSEILVGAVEEAALALGMSELFVGLIVVAVIGNAAEHSTAVLMALRQKMDLAIQIAVGSSVQIALFVAPLLVFLSYFVGPAPMDLRFTTFEVVAVALTVFTIAQIAQDGETNWMEGVQLLAVYLILAIAFFYLPA